MKSVTPKSTQVTIRKIVAIDKLTCGVVIGHPSSGQPVTLTAKVQDTLRISRTGVARIEIEAMKSGNFLLE